MTIGRKSWAIAEGYIPGWSHGPEPDRVTVPARRTMHLRLNELRDPEPIPRETPFASVIKSDQLIVVQHTRLDSRQSENALLSTIAFPGEA